jgi:hypothetical protein
MPVDECTPYPRCSVSVLLPDGGTEAANLERSGVWWTYHEIKPIAWRHLEPMHHG